MTTSEVPLNVNVKDQTMDRAVSTINKQKHISFQ